MASGMRWILCAQTATADGTCGAEWTRVREEGDLKAWALTLQPHTLLLHAEA